MIGKEQIGAYLNENASPEEFNMLDNCIERLENIISDDLYPLFTSKDSFLLFTLFHRFTDLGLDDGKFADFLYAFKNGLCNKAVEGKIFYEKGRSLKDKPVIAEKLDLLETLMCEYLGISGEELKPEQKTNSKEVLAFVQENVNPDVTGDDLEQYSEVLEGLMEKSNCDGKLLEAENKPSLLAIVAHSFICDLDLDDWIVDYCRRNSDYISSQVENYQYMVSDLEQYLENSDAKHTEAA